MWPRMSLSSMKWSLPRDSAHPCIPAIAGGDGVGRTPYVSGMQLTRKLIIGAAIELIEQDGVDAVSMQRLASELGCGVVSLYHHVPSRSALLDGVADAVMSGIAVTSVPGTDWQEQVRAQARAFRQITRAHPRCAMVVISRPASSAAIVRPAEDALATLRAAGFAIFGAGLSCTFPLLLSAAGRSDPARPSRGIATVAGLGYVGMLTGPVLIGGLASAFGLTAALLVPVLLALAICAGAGLARPRR